MFFVKFIAPLNVVLAVLVLSSQAFAFETRFAIDPAVDVQKLAQSGQIASRVDRKGHTITSDASAVLTVNVDKLLNASVDFANYKKMGIPNVKDSRVLPGTAGDTIYTWTHMEWSQFGIFTKASKHYLDVRVSRGLTPSGAMGTSWEQTPKRAQWNQVEDSAFESLEGSWYIEPIGNGKIYVRYFLSAKLDTGTPGFILDVIAKRQFKKGVEEIIRILAREAAAKR